MKLKLNFIIRLNGTIANTVVFVITWAEEDSGILSKMEVADPYNPNSRAPVTMWDAEHCEIPCEHVWASQWNSALWAGIIISDNVRH